MDNKRLLGNGLLLLATMIWGTSFAIQRTGMEYVEPVTFTAARMFLATAAVGLVAWFIRQKKGGSAPSQTQERQNGRNTVIGGIWCGIFLAFGTVLQQMGLVYTSAGKAGFITVMYMLLVPVFGFVLLGKKSSWLVLAAVLLGLVGMYFLCISGEFRLQTGDLLVFACAVFYAGHILCVDHYAPQTDPIALSAVQFAAVTALATVAAFVMEEPAIEKLIPALWPIVYSGFVSAGIGFTLQTVAQKYTEPATASLLMSMEAVFAVIAGALMLHEHMTARELCGCAIMFAAVVMVQIPVMRKKE